MKSFLAHFTLDGEEEWEALAGFLEESFGWSVYGLPEEEAASYRTEALESGEAFEAWYDALCDSCGEEYEEEEEE